MKYEDFARYYDQIFPFNSQQCNFLDQYITASSQVLELGCGTGALAGNIAQRAKSIIGIDNDSEMINMALSRFPNLDFRILDILDIGNIPGQFDLIFSTGNVLSYIDNDNYNILCNLIYDKLSPGGLWLFQVVNWNFFSGMDSYHFPVKNIADMQFKRSYEFLDKKQGVCFSLELILSDADSFKDTHLLYSRNCQEYIQITSNAGLIQKGCWLDWMKTPWTADANGGIIQLWQKG